MASKATEISIIEFQRGSFTVCILGTTPFICNRMAEKAKWEITLPGRKTKAELQRRLKHDPLREYQASPYISHDEEDTTLIRHKATAFKNAIRCAALDTPGATKAAIGRLVWVEGEWVNIYGTPQLFMEVVRQRDMNRTPDMRTRAILPHWGALFTISYAKPVMNDVVIANLLASAGITNGMGDWRQQQGSGSYGAFELVAPTDPRFLRLMDLEGREAQRAALYADPPTFYNEDSQEMYEWVYEEIARRGQEGLLGRDDEDEDDEDDETSENGLVGAGAFS